MIVAVIPAKGGSKRLPNKNMHIINGKPLLEYTVRYVKESKLINDFYVTTDNKQIIDIPFNFTNEGSQVIFKNLKR